MTNENYRITADDVHELATLVGGAVAVPSEEGVGGLWVIGTGNRHYQGAYTVYATSHQVEDLARDDDWDGMRLRPEAAQRIADELTAAGMSAACQSALEMPNPGGHPDAPSGLPGDTGMTGVQWRRHQAEKGQQ